MFSLGKLLISISIHDIMRATVADIDKPKHLIKYNHFNIKAILRWSFLW